MSPEVSVDAVMDELRDRVRERLRQTLVAQGDADAADPAIFADVERILTRSVDHDRGLLLPELLGDPATWRLDTALRYQSHRGAAAGGAIVWLKRQVVLPLTRWLFEYSRDNFERQRRVNDVLFACVQELALETARLKRAAEPPAS